MVGFIEVDVELVEFGVSGGKLFIFLLAFLVVHQVIITVILILVSSPFRFFFDFLPVIRVNIFVV